MPVDGGDAIKCVEVSFFKIKRACSKLDLGQFLVSKQKLWWNMMRYVSKICSSVDF